jgi:hypothetical protein
MNHASNNLSNSPFTILVYLGFHFLFLLLASLTSITIQFFVIPWCLPLGSYSWKQTNGYTYTTNFYIIFFPYGEGLVIVESCSIVPRFFLLSTHLELISHYPFELFDLPKIKLQPWGLFQKRITLFSFHWNHLCKSLQN